MCFIASWLFAAIRLLSASRAAVIVMFKASGLFFSKSLQVPSSLGLTEGKSFRRRSMFVLSRSLSELIIYALSLEFDFFLTVFFCLRLIFSILTLAKVGTVNF